MLGDLLFPATRRGLVPLPECGFYPLRRGRVYLPYRSAFFTARCEARGRRGAIRVCLRTVGMIGVCTKKRFAKPRVGEWIERSRTDKWTKPFHDVNHHRGDSTSGDRLYSRLTTADGLMCGVGEAAKGYVTVRETDPRLDMSSQTKELFMAYANRRSTAEWLLSAGCSFNGASMRR